MALHIGTSGWNYDHWENALYPEGLPVADRLDRYVSRFNTVELTASFFRWPHADTFARWRETVPLDFQLSVKAPRALTHGKKLYAPEAWVARIIESWHELAESRGVLLVQLPASLQRDDARLDYFLALFPSWVRVAVELRHDSWNHEDVFAILQSHGASYCVMSGAGLPCILRTTSPTVYVRLHGPDQTHLYGGSYSDEDLAWWSERIDEWDATAADVFVYFNNDGGGHAVRNAAALRRLCRSLAGRPEDS